MTNGFGAMPDYAAQIKVEDRWAIAAYIRALQLSEHAAVADVQMRSQQARKRVRELRDMAASHGEPAGQAGKCGPAAGDVHAAAQLLDTGSCRGQQPVVQAIDAAEEFVLSRDDELGGGRRSRRPDIGHEVGDRHVAFVTDR